MSQHHHAQHRGRGKTAAQLTRYVRRQHEPVSLKTLLIRRGRNWAIVTASFLASYTMMSHLNADMLYMAPPGSDATASQKAQEDERETRLVGLMREYDCWRRAAPKDVVTPGGVLYSSPSTEGEIRVGGPRYTHRALEDLFGNTDSDLTVYAFCRLGPSDTSLR